MIYKNLELHNVSEVQETCLGGVLQRFPEAVRQKLEKRRNFRAEDCAGVEIRFASDAYCVELVLKCLYGGGLVTVFRGPHTFATRQAAEGQTFTLHLEPIEAWNGVSFGDRPCWARNIWRIQLPPAQFALCHLETYGAPVRPPKAGERPARTLMVYGSSITQGCFAQNNSLSYAQHTGARLGWDVKNLGLSGACFCEPEMAGFLGDTQDWDAAVLEIGVNMRPFFTEGQFLERANFLVDRVCEKNPQKPVVLVTIFPNMETLRPEESFLQKRENAYCRILRDMADAKRHPNLHLLEGKDILKDPGYLGADLIHPTDFGHLSMGENLAAALKPILKAYHLA